MTNSTTKTKILVWDAPVRVFHWLLVLSFAGAYLTAESERWRLVHVSLGYTMGGLVAFRILWGLVGTRYARFASFVRGPAAVMRYGRALLSGKPEHHVGHNPAGAWAIVLLLLLSIATVASGWAIYNEVGGNALEDLHEGAANFMLAVVGVHVAGVLLASWLHRENLVRAMLTGKKEGTPEEGIRWPWRPLALVLLAAVLGFWWLQWQSAPADAAAGTAGASENAKYSHMTAAMTNSPALAASTLL
ncbi:MAG: cytochrome B [Rhodoferax sp.]|uniref:cytochrome b/b6 domain-containing protein n=1 Tax=Rhodoferax sp. TaxID=50421 RepID=UPI00185DE3E5|nr:cytochrome b/b6 domain-containing protein [Rhodoferax sp.]NMM14742.1 cytochrome B [Rhodoferax sp.]NMM18499.1 cytochrome B [Rhodoferax sp.]